LHNASRLIVGGPASRGETRRLGAAVEQGSAERLLEGLNPTRHAWLREVQSERRAADRAGLDDRNECFEIRNIHARKA
jgi:hypothetical protein